MILAMSTSATAGTGRRKRARARMSIGVARQDRPIGKSCPTPSFHLKLRQTQCLFHINVPMQGDLFVGCYRDSELSRLVTFILGNGSRVGPGRTVQQVPAVEFCGEGFLALAVFSFNGNLGNSEMGIAGVLYGGSEKALRQSHVGYLGPGFLFDRSDK